MEMLPYTVLHEESLNSLTSMKPQDLNPTKQAMGDDLDRRVG